MEMSKATLAIYIASYVSCFGLGVLAGVIVPRLARWFMRKLAAAVAVIGEAEHGFQQENGDQRS